MKKIRKMFLGASLILSTLQAQAAVNLQTGAWIWELDLQGLKINYNSRSLHHGWWGQGWCSDLDLSLSKQEGQLVLSHCSVKQYVPILKAGDSYEVTYENRHLSFDIDLNLRSIRSKTQNIQIVKQTENTLLVEINQTAFHIVKNAFGKVSEVTSGSDKFTLNHLEGKLTEVKKGRKTYHFEYDDLDNMNYIKPSDLEGGVYISYDQSDRVKSVRANTGCVTNYEFSEFNMGLQTILTSKVLRRCKDRPLSFLRKSVSSTFERLDENNLALVSVKEVYL